jgi:hypothetical protein
MGHQSQTGSWDAGNSTVNFMVKRNFLNLFVSSLTKDDDGAICALMENDPCKLSVPFLTCCPHFCEAFPDNWPFLYIFEAKTSLFLRISQQRDGIERLADAGLIEALVDCKFFDSPRF